MEKVTLYKFKSDRIKITMEIYFNEKDQLIFDGYDVGQIVTELQFQETWCHESPSENRNHAPRIVRAHGQ